jgi:tRNA (guanosine-2'-O-)-methyltransferase
MVARYGCVVRRDDPDAYQLRRPAELRWPAEVVIEALSPTVLPGRLERIRAVAHRRTRDVVPVLENLHDPHNASAVLRTSDAFGIQDVAMVREDNEFLAANRVAQGTHRWLDLHLFSEPAECAEWLKKRGHRILVAKMDGNVGPETLGDGKVAVVFGNEHRGVSSSMAALADDTYAIPMMGFVESLNVSVAAAVTLYAATAPRMKRGEHLPAPDAQVLFARFLMGNVRDAERIVEEHAKSR